MLFGIADRTGTVGIFADWYGFVLTDTYAVLLQQVFFKGAF